MSVNQTKLNELDSLGINFSDETKKILRALLKSNISHHKKLGDTGMDVFDAEPKKDSALKNLFNKIFKRTRE